MLKRTDASKFREKKKIACDVVWRSRIALSAGVLFIKENDLYGGLTSVFSTAINIILCSGSSALLLSSPLPSHLSFLPSHPFSRMFAFWWWWLRTPFQTRAAYHSGNIDYHFSTQIFIQSLFPSVTTYWLSSQSVHPSIHHLSIRLHLSIHLYIQPSVVFNF